MLSKLRKINIKFSWSGLSLLIIAVALIWSMLNIKLWKVGDKCARSVINQDVTNYYAYLPAAFIHHDLTFQFALEEGTTYGLDCEFWPVPVEGKENSFVIKMTMGLSYMYMPFFLMAHVYTKNFTDYPADGFSPPYEFFLVLSSVIYLIIGFYFLRKLLLRFFSDGVTAAVMLMTIFGTNLYYYGSSEPAMSHAYSFTLFAIFAYLSVLWVKNTSWKLACGIGLIGGLIALIRPVNIFVFIFPLLYGVTTMNELKIRFNLVFGNFKQLWQLMGLVFYMLRLLNGSVSVNNILTRIKYLFQIYKHLLVLVGAGFLVVFPQLLFWKINSGNWIYYSYSDEHFFFGNPHVLDGLFSYRKGWLLYTPIMVFPIIGIVFSYFNRRELFWPYAIYLPIHIYVIYSWWCWWYGGSYGSRPMIETYAILAIPFGIWVSWVAKHIVGIVNFSILAVLCVGLNLFQTARYRYGSIHYHGMSKEAYWLNFGKRDPAPGFYDVIIEPDYDKAKRGEDT